MATRRKERLARGDAHFAINFAVTTVSRRPTYIHKLTASFGKRLPLRLVVGAPDVLYLQRYLPCSTIQIIRPPDDEWEKFKDRRVQHRATWNYWRTLTLGPESGKKRGLVIFEDDVILARSWLAHLSDAIDELEDEHGGVFALSLYAAYPMEASPDFSGYSVPYPAGWFFGTQAMYYPERVRKEFARFLFINGVQKDRRAYDLLLQEYLEFNEIPLANTFPCLAQHIGKVSTGLGSFHSACNFNSKINVGSRSLGSK